ncbi:hypothetical protein [Pseudonocardia sp.]|uniref:hypothetical protein n=1 Tax=Pseudonocardia sp. TaxID=60912 RepID=UPI003D0FCDF8
MRPRRAVRRGAGDSRSGLLAVLTAILAPTTLLTAVMFYFGWSFSYHYFDSLGVEFTVLGFTTQDYLLRSVDPLFVPVVVLAALVLAVLWIYDLAAGRVGPARLRVLGRRIAPALVLCGALLVGAGLYRLAGRTDLEFFLIASPVALALGVLLLHLASACLRASPPSLTERAAVFVLVGISVFWAAQLYASEVGRIRAEQTVADLDGAPWTTVYSEKPLSIHAPDVVEQACAAEDAAYGFRYTGLVLVLQSGDQYVLLPRSWAQLRAPAIVLPRSDAIRLEFAPRSSPQSSGC